MFILEEFSKPSLIFPTPLPYLDIAKNELVERKYMTTMVSFVFSQLFFFLSACHRIVVVICKHICDKKFLQKISYNTQCKITHSGARDRMVSSPNLQRSSRTFRVGGEKSRRKLFSRRENGFPRRESHRCADSAGWRSKSAVRTQAPISAIQRANTVTDVAIVCDIYILLLIIRGWFLIWPRPSLKFYRIPTLKIFPKVGGLGWFYRPLSCTEEFWHSTQFLG